MACRGVSVSRCSHMRPRSWDRRSIIFPQEKPSRHGPRLSLGQSHALRELRKTSNWQWFRFRNNICSRIVNASIDQILACFWVTSPAHGTIFYWLKLFTPRVFKSSFASPEFLKPFFSRYVFVGNYWSKRIDYRLHALGFGLSSLYPGRLSF